MRMKLKKGISIILVMLMVIGGMTGIMIPGVEKAYAADGFAVGDGVSAATAYEIATADELNNVRTQLDTGKYFKLTADINLSSYATDPGGWVPIGSLNSPFNGNIDGNGHIITGLVIDRPSEDYVGLFGDIGNNANVTNMKLESVNVKGRQAVGGLVGYSDSGTTVSNSYVTGSVSGGGGTGGQTGTGGLVGYSNGTISNSYATGIVSGNYRVGGLVGSSNGTISNSYASEDVSGTRPIGGFVGVNYSSGTISNSYAKGSVSGSDYVGGFAGNNYGTISNSYATGNVSSSGTVGGLVGQNLNGTISSSFYDSATTGQPLGDTGKGFGKSTAEMKTQSEYSDPSWDFSTIWVIDSSQNNGYPILRTFYFVVSYNGNGNTGGNVPNSNFFPKGVTASVYSGAVDLVKTGYTFAGWNALDNGNGTDYASAQTFTITADTTLYAKWLSAVATLTSTNGIVSTGGTASETITNVTYGTTLAAFKTAITPAKSATFQVYDADGVTVATTLATGKKVIVTAQDGTTKVTYTVTVNTPPSANALLSSLAVDQGTLTPAFLSSNLNYTVGVTNAVSDLNIFLIKADPTETLTVTGATYSTVTGSVYSYRATNLIVGSNPIQIVVTAQDGTTNSLYVLTVNRAPAASSNADLNGLTLSSGALSPIFASGTTGYTSSVANGVSSLTVTGSVYDSNARMTVNGISIISGQASGAISLNVGSNPITIVVTAQNGTTKIYTITVTRAAQVVITDGGTTIPTNSKVTSTDGNLTLPAGKTGEVSLKNEVTISIPADATGKDLKLTIDKVLDTQKLLTNNAVLASPIFEILKNFSENFSKPVTLTFAFDPATLKKGQKAAVFYYDEAKKEWVEVGGKVNGDHINVDVDHFTKYAVFAVDITAEVPVKPNLNFSDISGHWSEANIKQAISSGIVTGYPDGTFKPEKTVTRAEFAVMLMNALKPKGDGAALTFADTAKIGAWAQKAVAQAVQAGIINGYEDGTFRPDAEITRAEMAAMLAKATAQTIDANAATGFADDMDIPAWAKASVAFVKKAGLVQGKGDNQFAPQDHATRAEAVTVLVNMLAQKSK